MWPEGAQDITETTKRPITAGTNFKNSIIALVDNLATKVRLCNITYQGFVTHCLRKYVELNKFIGGKAK